VHAAGLFSHLAERFTDFAALTIVRQAVGALAKPSVEEKRMAGKMITGGCGMVLLACLAGPVPGSGLPWANGRFVYEFSPEVQRDPRKTESFEQACGRLLENTALKCVKRSQAVAMNDRDYVYVVDGDRDASYIGRRGGKQLLSILIWNNPNIISHEIKHALGWGHEQQHPDRDQYVDILFDNIPQEKQENFTIYDRGNEGEYDFDSVMHYYPTDFARPTRKSIRAKPEYRSFQSVMGQRDHLSTIDLLEIQEFYGSPAVQWCAISRKPEGNSLPGCAFVCQLQSDPAVGTWVPDKACDS
jgi:hypothetical protein